MYKYDCLEDLERLFGAFGDIDTLKIMRNIKTGESFRIGFVKYLFLHSL